MRLATGSRIQSAADDPAGAAAVLRIREQEGQFASFARNIDSAESRLGLEEGVLDGITLALQRVRELALAGNNAPLGATERAALAAEVDARLSELIGLANTRDASGEYLFSGTQFNLKPFAAANGVPAVVYSGDQGHREVEIASGQRVAVNDSGFRVFQSIRNGNGTFSTSPGVANTGEGVISPGEVVDATAYSASSFRLHAAMAAAPAAGALSFNDAGLNDTLGYELRINGVLIHALGEGAGLSVAGIESDINAQSGLTGVRAVADGPELYLINTAANGQSIDITETLTGATEGADGVSGFFGAALTGFASSQTTSLGPIADSFVVEDSVGSLEIAGPLSSGKAIQFAGIEIDIGGDVAMGDSFDIDPSVNQDLFTTTKLLSDGLAKTGAPLHNAINAGILALDRALENVELVRAGLGARLNRLELQSGVNGALALQLATHRSALEDLDLVAAAGELSGQLAVLEAAQQSYIRIQGLSLFNLLR